MPVTIDVIGGTPGSDLTPAFSKAPGDIRVDPTQVQAKAPGMLPLLAPALIGGAASLLGGVMANHASAKQARNQMDFQAHMSNTAHQREVADLRAAGLNPILTATGGHGASSPGGAMATQQDVMSPAVASGKEAAIGVQQAKLMREQIGNTAADSDLKDAQRQIAIPAQATQAEATSRAANAQAALAGAQAQNADASNALINQQVKTEVERTKSAAAEARLFTNSAKNSDWEQKAFDTLPGQVGRWARFFGFSGKDANRAISR